MFATQAQRHEEGEKKIAMLEERYALGSLRLRGKKSFYRYPSRPPGRSSNEVLLKRSTPMTSDK